MGSKLKRAKEITNVWGGGIRRSLRQRTAQCWCDLKSKLACERAQGTTEYAILVGVIVVIAILAITIFKPKLQELWDAIVSGIEGL